MKTKALSIILMVVAIANVILLALKKINNITFWIIVAIIAILAFKVIPKISKLN